MRLIAGGGGGRLGGVHNRLHIYPLCGIFYFPWHRHQIEGTNGFYCLIRKTQRFTISNVESQVFTPNNSRLDPGSNPGCPRDKRMSYHWTNCASLMKVIIKSSSRRMIIEALIQCSPRLAETGLIRPLRTSRRYLQRSWRTTVRRLQHPRRTSRR